MDSVRMQHGHTVSMINKSAPCPGAGVDPPQSLGGVSAGEANVCGVFGGEGRAGASGAAATPRAAGGRPARPAGGGEDGGGGHEEESGSERSTAGRAAGEHQDADREEQRQAGGEDKQQVNRKHLVKHLWRNISPFAVYSVLLIFIEGFYFRTMFMVLCVVMVMLTSLFESQTTVLCCSHYNTIEGYTTDLRPGVLITRLSSRSKRSGTFQVQM